MTTKTMLVLTAITAALVVLPCAVSAQPQWEVELVGGVGFTRVTGDTEFSETIDGDTAAADIGGFKAGFAGGGLVTVYLNPRFGIQSGLVWARKGSDGELVVDLPSLGLYDVTANVTYTLDYIDLPILGVLDFPVTDVVSIRTMAGPVISFNTKAEVKIELGGASESQDVGDETRSVDFGGLLGAGVAIPAGAVRIHLDARYTFGFTSVDDSPADLDLKNGGFAILAGIGIPLNG